MMNYLSWNDTTRVIATKMNIPCLRQDWLERERLKRLLDQGMQGSFLLVSAPAGYGKSVFVAQWLNSRKEPRGWLSLDYEDNNPIIFLEYLIAAIEQLFPQTCLKTKEYLKANCLLSWQNLKRLFLNDINQINQSFILVLDNYHCINHPEMHEFLNLILKYPPPALHLVIITRTDPPFSLCALRAQGQLTELRAKELAFTRLETEHFLHQHQFLEFKINQQALLNLQNKLEGWAVGLRLISLALADQGNPNNFLCHWRGEIASIEEYLREEVLAVQLPIVKKWLTQFSMFNRFCFPLLKAVFLSDEMFQESDFLHMINSGNLLVTPLDEAGKWYRYHPLLRKVLLKQLQEQYRPQDITSWHLQASQWFESEDLIDDAIAQALAANDMTRAVEIIERHRLVILNGEQWDQLEQWLKQIPPEILQQRSQLLLSQGWINCFRDQFREVALILQQLADNQLASELLAEFNSLQGMVSFWEGQVETSLRYLEKALDSLSEKAHRIRNQTQLYFGLALYSRGQKQNAIEFFTQNWQRLYPNHDMAKGLGLLYTLSSQLTPALEIAQQVETSEPVHHWAHYLQGAAYLRRNHLEQGVPHFRSVVESGNGKEARLIIDSFVGLALTYQALQQRDSATATIKQGLVFARETGDFQMIAIAHSAQARLALLQGDLCLASQWLHAFEDTPDASTLFCWLEVPVMTKVRILCAIGCEQSLQNAAKLLQTLRKEAETHHYTCQLIEIRILQALVFKKQRDWAEALAVLESVIPLAASGNLIRPFLEFGYPIATLVRQLHQYSPQCCFKRRILEILNLPTKPSQFNIQMIEYLTHREAEILEMLSQRLQDKEIAKQLGISTTTVKSHLKHLYQKLNVHSRRQAVVRGMECGLIPPIYKNQLM